MKLMAMGRLKLVDDEGGRPTIVEATGLIVEATPQELRASAHLMLEDVELRPAPLDTDGTNLLAAVSVAFERLRKTVAACRAKHGRDAVRSLPWGTTLDAMDSGRTALHPDDQQAAITDRAFVRWLHDKPIHERERLVRRVLDEMAPDTPARAN